MKSMNVFLCLMLLALSFPGAANVNTDNLVLLPVRNDPTISFRIWFKVGSQNDPKGKEGLSALTASMITEGATLRHSYQEIIEKLYPLAAGYSATNGAEMTVITGRVHRDNVKEYYTLLMNAILSPGFRQEDLDRIKSQTLNALENTLRYSSDEELGKAVLYGKIYAGTPYAHIPAGTVTSVKSITLDDIRAFYSKYFTRGNVVIGLGGGYDDALLSLLQKDLATLPDGTPTPVPAPKPAPVSGFQVVMVEKDAQATAISMGFPMSVLRGQKEWYALAIANSWLGEHRNSSSHLYQVIREARGLNYGDYSYIEHYPNGGFRMLPPQNASRRQHLFEIWIRPVPNETRHFSLRAALREFKNLVERGMTQEEFDLKRKFLRNYVLNYAPTTMERLGYALDDKFYGITGSHLEMFRSAMDGVTLADVYAAIKKHWQFGNMTIAIVTKDAEGFKKALVADSPSPITYATPKPESVLMDDKVIQSFPLPIKEDRVTILPVGKVFE